MNHLLDACDRTILQLAAQVQTLQREYAEMRNELSLLTSVQRTLIAHEARIEGLEKRLASSSMVERSPVKGVDAGSSPASPATLAVPFGSVGKLAEQVERIFDCKQGDFRAYHSVWDEELTGYREFSYSTFVVIAPASMLESQERLRQVIYTALFKLKQTCKSERPVLYWRFAKEERIQEEEGRSDRVGASHKIYTRLAIPEADFSVVEGITCKEGEPAMILGRN